MKDGVVIVNTARGAVIDEEALAKALDSKKVAGVGLDVFEFEPDYIHPGVLNHPNALLVPHMGTYTVEVSATSVDYPHITCSAPAIRAFHILMTTVSLKQTNKAMEEWCIDNLKRALLTGTLKSPVPEQASF